MGLKVALFSLNSPVTTSAHYMRAFKRMEQSGEIEQFIPGGPEYSNYNIFKPGEFNPAEKVYAYPITWEKRPHPEWIDWQELLDLGSDAGYDLNKIDVLLVHEPNVFVEQKKAKIPESIKTAYMFVDTHRGAWTSWIACGAFRPNKLFIANAYHHELYNLQNANLNDYIIPRTWEVEWLPCAADAEHIQKPYPEMEEYEKYDIVFSGNDGIQKAQGGNLGESKYIFASKRATVEWSGEDGNSKKEIYQIGPYTDHRFQEYSQRAMFLVSLLKAGFNVHFENELDPINYAKILNKGKIIFNCSIFQDCNMRIAEAGACGRALVTDDVLGVENVIGENGETHLQYRRYSHPDSANFTFDFQCMAHKISWLLENENARKEMGRKAREYVLAHSTYDIRAMQVLKSLGVK